jgi:hypothetical protein
LNTKPPGPRHQLDEQPRGASHRPSPPAAPPAAIHRQPPASPPAERLDRETAQNGPCGRLAEPGRGVRPACGPWHRPRAAPDRREGRGGAPGHERSPPARHLKELGRREGRAAPGNSAKRPRRRPSPRGMTRPELTDTSPSTPAAVSRALASRVEPLEGWGRQLAERRPHKRSARTPGRSTAPPPPPPPPHRARGGCVSPPGGELGAGIWEKATISQGRRLHSGRAASDRRARTGRRAGAQAERRDGARE